MEEPDPQLISAARSGDAGSFESLIRRYQAPVYRFVVHLIGDPSAAEDVTQETFVRAFRSLRRYRGDSRFTTWLFAIARNCATDHLRRAARRGRLSRRLEGRVPDPEPDSSLGLELREALDALPSELLEPTLLIDLWGFSYSEVARLTSTPEGTIKSRVHRARQRLIQSLAPGVEETRNEI